MTQRIKKENEIKPTSLNENQQTFMTDITNTNTNTTTTIHEILNDTSQHDIKQVTPIQLNKQVFTENSSNVDDIKKVIDEKPLSQLFDDDDDEDDIMNVDQTPLDHETYRLLTQYDDPWADLKDPHVMLNFYKKLFPWKQLFLWLNQDYAPNHLFTHREFAVTLQNEAYLRYNSYSSYLDLQKDIIRLNPSRFEIGPTYTAAPKDKKSIPKSAFKPIMRELVFDIDLTDYDDVRTCCSDKKICKKCWKFIPLAATVLDKTLRDDFGFKHLLWVYSGRRGIHCWVSDQEALRYNDEQRKAIVNYIDLMRGGGTKSGLKVNTRLPLHPMVKRSLEMLKKGFEEVVLKEQEVFKTELNRKILENSTSEKEALPLDLTSHKKLDEYLKSKKADDLKHNIILHYTYPRIDLEVTKHLNHLLKSPFCVHPATGKVCVPIDLKKIDQFDPDQVPDVRELLRELDRHGKQLAHRTTHEETTSTTQLNWSHSALKPYVEIFQKHIDGLLQDRLHAKKEVQTNSIDF